MEEKKIDICIPCLVKNTEAYRIKKANFLKLIGIPVNNILISSKKGLANARNDLMKKTATEWFLFLDDDIVLNKKWWKKISRYMDSDKIGAICGFGLPDSTALIILRHLFLMRGLRHQRGFASNTLIKKKAVEGIILTREGRLEDLELQEKIKAKGYEWKFCLAYCRHTKKPGKVFAEAFSDFIKIKKEKGIFKAIMSI